MNILFTGASSFTGYWFVKELIRNGFNVICTYTKESSENYDGIRRERVLNLSDETEQIFGCTFGSEKFIEMIKGKDWACLCHHAADVKNYKSLEFSIPDALQNNTNNLTEVFNTLKENNCYKVIFTGSVFENNEGAGSDGLPAFSPYGLSKSFSYEILKFHSKKMDINLGKFVIPNPFGPFEEFRFTQYLIKNWFESKCPDINTPLYIRDNIHISLLAKSYSYFVKNFVKENQNKIVKYNPSGYIESQGDFAKRFSGEMKNRLNLPCDFNLKEQKDFDEPMERFNTQPALKLINENWSEKEAWDEIANYYCKIYKK